MSKGYVCLLGTEDFLPGVLAVNKGLQAVGAQYPLECIITCPISDVSVNKLEAVKISTRYLPALQGNYTVEGKHYAPTFSKLLLWSLYDYKKIVYLDADLYILKNLDHLFDLNESFAAAPDVCADTFNSGMMLLTPDQTIFNQLQHLSANTIPYDSSDQGILNIFFNNWYASSQRLTMAYNLPFLLAQNIPGYVDFVNAREGVKVVHFWGPVKPWAKEYKPECPNNTAKKLISEYQQIILSANN